MPVVTLPVYFVNLWWYISYWGSIANEQRKYKKRK